MSPDDPPNDAADIEPLDPELFEAPRRLSREDCRDHIGGGGLRLTDPEQDDDR